MFTEVRKSNIRNAGKGVFATRNIKRHTTLGKYTGLYMKKKTVDRIYGNDVAPYVLSVTCTDASNCGTLKRRHVAHTMCIDASVGGNWTSYINDGPHSGLAENVYFDDDGTIITLVDIKKGEELYISYGTEYWQ